MGTNYYLVDERFVDPDFLDDLIDEHDPEVHIGKTSNSGLYCYDYNISLVTGEPAKSGKNPHMSSPNFPCYEKCPKCGKKDDGSVGNTLELFKSPLEFITEGKKTGVDQSYSFSYAMNPRKVKSLPNNVLVRDGYGRNMTMKDMRRIIENAIFKFTESVGKHFC